MKKISGLFIILFEVFFISWHIIERPIGKHLTYSEIGIVNNGFKKYNFTFGKTLFDTGYTILDKSFIVFTKRPLRIQFSNYTIKSVRVG